MQTHALREMLHLFLVEKYSTITPQTLLAVLFLVSLAKHSWV